MIEHYSIMITAGKSKYACLLSFLRAASPPLYNAINDLCLDGMFRSQRFQNTFLMPDKKLIAKIQKMIEDDKDMDAIDGIRSLMLKGHLTDSDFKKDAKIGTLQFGSHVLANPEQVGKAIKTQKKEIIATKNGAYATIIFNYNDDEFPKTIAGTSGGMTLVGKVNGGATNHDAELIKTITLKLIRHNDVDGTLRNFFKAVAGVLIILENTDKDRFHRAKFYLAANPILSWFFLTMPRRDNALVRAHDLKDFQWESVTDLNIISKAEAVGYSLDRNLLKKIKNRRSDLINEKGDRSSLITMINNIYNELLPELAKVHAIDAQLAGDAGLKMLMDELRFVHEGSVTSWDQIDEAVSRLGMISWDRPTDSLLICDKNTYEKNLMKGVEAFMSGPVMFVKSIYFLYVPLTDAVEAQLSGGVNGGAILGGNPASINNVVFSGGAARKQLKKASEVKLTSLVKILSRQQREALKEML